MEKLNGDDRYTVSWIWSSVICSLGKNHPLPTRRAAPWGLICDDSFSPIGEDCFPGFTLTEPPAVGYLTLVYQLLSGGGQWQWESLNHYSRLFLKSEKDEFQDCFSIWFSVLWELMLKGRKSLSQISICHAPLYPSALCQASTCPVQALLWRLQGSGSCIVASRRIWMLLMLLLFFLSPGPQKFLPQHGELDHPQLAAFPWK